MDSTDPREPWVKLKAMVESGDAGQLDEYLHHLAPGEPARALSRLDEYCQAELIGLLPDEDAAALLTELPKSQAVDILGHLTPNQAAVIVDEVTSDQLADLQGALETQQNEAILERIEDVLDNLRDNAEEYASCAGSGHHVGSPFSI